MLNPAKIQRLNPTAKNNCSNCSELKNFFQKELCDVKEQLKQLKQNNEAIMEVLANQTVLIKSLVRQQTDVNAITSDFPIANEDVLAAVDGKINAGNRSYYVGAMKSVMAGGNPKKKLLAILNDQIIIDFNIDGTHGKKRLKDFTKFYHALKDAFGTSEQTNPEEVIRKAFQAVKKQHFHSECLKRKATEPNF